jgi:hypothetical protein
MYYQGRKLHTHYSNFIYIDMQNCVQTFPGTNPTIMSYSSYVVNFYNSLARFKNKNNFFYKVF